jgi:hypothetical protein
MDAAPKANEADASVDLSLIPQQIRSRVGDIDGVRARLEELMEDPESDPDASIEEAMARFIEDATEDTALALCAYLRTGIEPSLAGLKMEIERLSKRRHVLEARAEWTRNTLVEMLRQLGTKRVQNAEYFATLRAGAERVEPTGDEIDVDMMPDDLVRRTPVVPDLAKVKAAIKAGREVHGYRLGRGPETVVVR